MKKQIFTACLLSFSALCFAQPNESMGDHVRKAFSLVGHWEIIKMEIDRSETMTNPGTVPEASVGQVNITVKSELGSYGSFDVAAGGAITGKGEAQYQYRVAGGSTAFSMQNITMPVGAVAMMNNDNGVRGFTITGSADLTGRTISLNAFQAQGGPLNMIIHPTSKTFTSVLWPPMTNISPTKVIVTGSSLLLRASGVLSGIKVYFEAVKYVDLAGLFEFFETYIDARINARISATINNNSNSNTTNNNNNNNNNNSNSNNNNNSNSNSNNNNNNKPNKDTSNHNTNTPGNTNGNANNQGPQPLVAGTVTVSMNGEANVIFKIPQTSANYAVSLTPVNLANNSATVSFSNKTPMGFKIHVKGNGSDAVKIDWLITPYTN